MASRRYRSRNSLNSNISKINAQVSQSSKRPSPKRLAANVVTSVSVQSAAIVTEGIADASVTTKKIAVEAITTDLIADGAVTADKLGADVQLGGGEITGLDAAVITTGTFNAARIPALDASKITTGTFSSDRLPTVPISKGGTGSTNSTGALSALGAAAASHTHTTSQITSFSSQVQSVISDFIIGGQIAITPVANTPTAAIISFAGAPFSGAPYLVATAYTTVPGSTLIEVGVQQVNSIAGRIYIYRTNTTATDVNWIAVSSSL